jgi:hypothetical protein
MKKYDEEISHAAVVNHNRYRSVASAIVEAEKGENSPKVVREIRMALIFMQRFCKFGLRLPFRSPIWISKVRPYRSYRNLVLHYMEPAESSEEGDV